VIAGTADSNASNNSVSFLVNPAVPSPLRELRYAGRLLIKSPGFTAVAVLVLALGIGATTAIFSIVNALVLRPLPTESPGIVGIYSKDTSRPDTYRAFSWESYETVRAAGVFEDVLAHGVTMVGLTEGDQTRRWFASIVTASYFSTLNVDLAAGRPFTKEEERPGSGVPVVIVGHQFARRLGGDIPGVLGRTVRLNARDYTIVGVTREGFSGTTAMLAPQFWLPTGVYEAVADEMFRETGKMRLDDPGHRPLMLVGRLRSGVDAESAAPRLAALSATLERQDPARNAHQQLMVQALPRLSVSTSPQRDRQPATISLLFMAMASTVLLVACLNLANMLLARGTSRRKEIALRLALGSGRWRIIRQLLMEGMLIALAGGAAGLVLAIWGTRLLASTFASVLPIAVTFDGMPDVRVLTATAALSGISALVAGLLPAWRVTQPDVLPDLKEQPAGGGRDRRVSLRNLLVVGQIALSLALLTAAGLFMRSAFRAAAADPGFPLDSGFIAGIDPGLGGFDEARGRSALSRVLATVRALPGVQSASLASIVPFGEFQDTRDVQKAGTPPAPEGQRDVAVDANYVVIGADYFETVRLPVMRGRGFTPGEESSSGGAPVVVVDEPLARQLFPGEDALGRQIQFARRPPGERVYYTIVGVVRGIRHDLFDQGPVPHVYLPYGQVYRGSMTLHVRPTAGPGAEAELMPRVRREIRAVEPGLPVVYLKTLAQHRDTGIQLWVVNTGARLFGVFGGIALLLAVIGVYGVKSYLVSRRTREIGIRVAIGAAPRDVMWMVLGDGLAMALGGVAVGLVLAWGVGRLLSGMLYEVSALDPFVFAVGPVVLVMAALAASWFPARRATRVAPLTALRSD
jgi:predicted permease